MVMVDGNSNGVSMWVCNGRHTHIDTPNNPN